MSGPALVLASASPRRAEYLRMLGIDFRVQAADIDESRLPEEGAKAHVERLAREKATAVAATGVRDYILAGDTVVVLGEEVLGKPDDADHAVRMLLSLRGRDHRVASAMALRTPDGEVHSGVSVTRVHFTEFDRAAAEAYVATGEPLDKAGAYGIQGKGAAVVASIEGDYYTVVGLPVPLVLRLFRRAGWVYGFGAWRRVDPGAAPGPASSSGGEGP